MHFSLYKQSNTNRLVFVCLLFVLKTELFNLIEKTRGGAYNVPFDPSVFLVFESLQKAAKLVVSDRGIVMLQHHA